MEIVAAPRDGSEKPDPANKEITPWRPWHEPQSWQRPWRGNPRRGICNICDPHDPAA